ncbi:UNVERIFIED_CONTAM: hypothetical protein FKN15_029831 [Acipenser sinensis]
MVKGGTRSDGLAQVQILQWILGSADLSSATQSLRTRNLTACSHFFWIALVVRALNSEAERLRAYLCSTSKVKLRGSGLTSAAPARVPPCQCSSVTMKPQQQTHRNA